MPDWQEYSRRKLQWMAENPAATAEEYDRAIRAIINELGV